MGIAYQRGMLLYDQKRYAMAADEFRKELAQFPSSANAIAMLALSLTYDRKQTEGIEIAKSAVAASPQNAFTHYALACAIVGPGLRFGGLKSFRLFGASARIFAYRRRLRKAKAPAMEALRLQPRNPDFLALMSGIELDLKHPREALQWANQGLAVMATHVRCNSLRGRALARLGRHYEAREAAKTALSLAPENAATHASSGWTHLQTGDAQTAVQHFSESVRLNPTDPNVHQGLAAAKKQASRARKVTSGIGLIGWAIYILLHNVVNIDGNGQNTFAIAIAILAGGLIAWRITKILKRRA
jgi:tetratricopeptide (TPR) repeat protein